MRGGEAFFIAIGQLEGQRLCWASRRIALTIRGRDYEYDGPGATLSNMKNVMRGCGPFVHDDPTDRPESTFAGKVTLHASADQQPYVLVPVIPNE